MSDKTPIARTRPIRLTVVMTHPVQYYGPWFRYIAANCPEIDLSVLYATEPDASQQGVGFGREFAWDVPLREGYRNRVLRPQEPGASVDASNFLGIDVPEIGDAIRADRPDVVLVPGWHSVTQLRALRACRRMSIPVLYRGDSNLANAPAGMKRWLWRRRTRWMLRHFSGYLSVGSRSRDYLNSFGVPADRIFDSPHCVDNGRFAGAADSARLRRNEIRQEFGFTADDFVVLFAGKFQEKKRPADAVRAVSRLGPNAALLMVGSGPLERALRAEAESLGVRVHWAGFVNQADIGKTYAVADCLVLPSDAGETWGLVVNECLAAGTPAVVSDRVGCAPDLITAGETGEVFPFADVAALAGAVERVRQSGRPRRDWTAACRARAEDYSFANATRGVMEACTHLLASRPKPRIMALCGGMVIVAGTERMTFEILRGLKERGAVIHVIVNSWENERIVKLAEEIGVPHSVGRYLSALRKPHSVARALAMLWEIAATSAALLRDSLRFRPTHIFVPQFTSSLRNYPALLLLRAFGIRILARMGNPPHEGRFYRRLFRYVMQPVTDLFVANSFYTRRELLKAGVQARRTTVIMNTVPRRDGTGNAAAEAPDPTRVVFVGQIIPPKGVIELLNAVGLLIARGVNVRLDVVGQIEGWESPSYGGYRQSVVERSRRPDLAGRVRFLGYRENVDECLRAGVIHCCPSQPSQREGFGIVNLEAKAAGLPSVVTPFGALPEVITHLEDGYVCRDGSAEAIAEGLEFFLANAAARNAAGAAARQSLDRFSRERFHQNYWDAFTISPAVLPPLETAPAGEALAPVRVLGCFGAFVFVAGMERINFEVLRVLRTRGAHLHVIVNSWENFRIAAQVEQIGATWVAGGYVRRLSRHVYNPWKLAQMAWEIASTSAILLREVRRFQPTHILLPDPISALRNYPALLMLRAMGTKIVLIGCNAPPDDEFYRRFWGNMVNRVVTDFVAISEFVRAEMRACGISDRKIHMFYPAAPTRVLEQPANSAKRDFHKIVYVGQINPEKGVDLLLEAVALLRRQGRNIHVDVVGDIDGWEAPTTRGYRAALRRRAQHPDLAGSVNFLGIREDVPAIMKSAAVHCCPSRPEQREAFGLVNLEAKLAGTPSVVSRTGAMPELVSHRIDGWICDELTPEALAEGLAHFLEPANFDAASSAALQSAARFAYTNFASQWIELFHEAGAVEAQPIQTRMNAAVHR